MRSELLRSKLKDKFKGKVREIYRDIFQVVELYEEKPFAVRYFDNRGEIEKVSKKLEDYLEEHIAKYYFDERQPFDLRWNNYLYFIVSDNVRSQSGFDRAKLKIESDFEYAKKLVISESELPLFLDDSGTKIGVEPSISIDLRSKWLEILGEHQLGFVLDTKIRPPAIVRKIERGESGSYRLTSPIGGINSNEQQAVENNIENLFIKGFREFPPDGEYKFGRGVNLITGPNGHGKTSLLEAIEFAYCGSTLRQSKFPPRTRVVINLVGTSESLVTTKSTAVARLKSRNLHWYGKRDVKGSSLCTSFSRFNFLDTDAAIRIAHDETSEKLSNDLTNIALGADASEASDHTQRVKSEIEKKEKIHHSNLKHSLFQIKTHKEEITNLGKLTRQSDTLKVQLDKCLKLVHWKSSLKVVDSESVATIVDDISDCNYELSILEGESLTSLRKIKKESESDIGQLELLVDSLRAINNKISTTVKDQKIISNKIEAVEEIKKYEATDLLRLHKQQVELLDQAKKFEQTLPNLENVGLLDKSFLACSLATYQQEIQKNLKKLGSDKEASERILSSLRNSVSSLKNLRSQLISVANQLLEAQTHKDQCPLCQARYTKGELATRFARIAEKESSRRYEDEYSRFICVVVKFFWPRNSSHSSSFSPQHLVLSQHYVDAV